MSKLYATCAAAACLAYGAVALARANMSGRHWLLLVRRQRGAFSIIGRRGIAGALPRSRTQPSRPSWSFEAFDHRGVLVHAGAICVPRSVRDERAHAVHERHSDIEPLNLAGDTFAMLVPAGAKTVVLYDGPSAPDELEAHRSATAASASIAQAGAATPQRTPIARLAL